MSTASIMQPAPSTVASDRPQRRTRRNRVRTHRTHLTTDPQIQSTESVLVEPQPTVLSDPAADLAFNPRSILPSTKSSKSLSDLQQHSQATIQAVASAETPFGRIDGCARAQTVWPSPSRTEKTPFIAFGIEAYPTRAVFDDICYDFVRGGRYCHRGRHCPRIHPKKKSEYLATVIRESVIYSHMRAQTRTQQPFGQMVEHETGPPPSSDPSPDMKIETSIFPVDPIRVKLPSVADDPTLKKIHQNVDEEDDNPWKAVRPKWHTDEGEPQSDRESGYWSNEPADSSRDVPTAMSAPFHLSRPTQGLLPRDRHPRPTSNERCRRWLRGQCELGYSCKYIHEDLDYDDRDAQDASGNKTTVVVLRRGPDTTVRTLHSHIRATFGPGFCVADLSTGFESCCVYIGGLLDSSDSDILELVKPFGKVRELRRPIDSTPQMKIKVYFEKTSEAFAALVALHGKHFMGCALVVKPGNESNSNRLVFKGNAVRFEWDAPCRTVYMGYSTRRLAEQATDDARLKPCQDFMAAANIHIGIPAVGAVTVRFRYLPLDVDQDKMKIFGPHVGMVTAKPNLNYSIQDLIRGFKHMLRSRKSEITDVHIRRPPYTNGKMKAWVTFANSRDAQAAAAKLHSSKEFMGGMAISAFHVKSISFALTPARYQVVAPDIRAFQDKLLRDDKGYWINVSERKGFVSIQFSGDDVKVLGKLKAEFERILNGEQLYDNGKVVWDPVLVGPAGRAFLDKLQQEHSGVIVITSSARCSIRLLGNTERRALARKRIIDFIHMQRARVQYTLPLSPDVLTAFAKDEQDGFCSLEVRLGQGNILLDSWQNALVISGDMEAYTIAKDALFAFRLKHQFIGWKGETCPACTGLASSPIKLPCGHSWCQSCLRHYLKSATEHGASFPLACHGIGKRCGEPIPIFTAREILAHDGFEALFQSAFSAHVLTHPEELHYCPTPDCPQIYRSTPEGIVMQCPECLSSICTHCHSESHEGLTCAEVQDGDGLFWEWAAGNNVNQCPKCKMAIEKTEGCNHLTCSMCSTHICWVCMQTFEDGLKIYGHMQSEHGGSGI